MILSTRSRYGLRLMIEIAAAGGKGLVALKRIAREESISFKYLGQIIIPLKARGLVQAARGVQGGYRLAVPAEKITVRQVIEAIEGGLSLLPCLDEPCERVSACAARPVWQRLHEAITGCLDGITLAELASDYRKRRQETLTFTI